ncbi:stage V sporulation protein AA [Kineothrix sp. MB12-C1]|uniref:stage V sporulation protein AA n=1 Tax=Kineothrix sp. MB12-C1 TaxID=3070215 RepID=UPI0027D309CF|nr:stage V sporulation protein AA [Kineothrix sp. MB12-C1]WMC91956.1 stage V sporulation protein AA [Kineothrix sp. MB12-C1]
MASETLYLKARRNVEVTTEDVFFKDVAQVYCADSHITAKVKSIKIHRFGEKGQTRQVFGVLKLIEMIEQACPNVDVENIGETDILVKRVKADKKKGFLVFLKIFFVAGISFFGTAFTIMAFHNDVGIHQVFSKVYELVMGEAAGGYTILELSYSIGLSVGIIVFFNHIGGRRITKDPTPIEVEMRIYEQDVDNALVETADREGKTIDVS